MSARKANYMESIFSSFICINEIQHKEKLLLSKIQIRPLLQNGKTAVINKMLHANCWNGTTFTAFVLPNPREKQHIYD